jgi:hypothetical protein
MGAALAGFEITVGCNAGAGAAPGAAQAVSKLAAKTMEVTNFLNITPPVDNKTKRYRISSLVGQKQLNPLLHSFSLIAFSDLQGHIK